VLCLSTDPAHSLGDALGLTLSARARRVPLSRGGGSLHAIELDADRALARWLDERQRLLRTIMARGTYLDDEDTERLMQLSLPGVDELVGLVELVRVARAGRYDQVVVDTAPTGHTLRLLEMPETLQRIAAVLDDMQAKHRLLAESLGGLWTGDAADHLIRDIDEEGAGLSSLLRDPARAAFVWMLLPEAMAAAEAEDGLAALARAGIAVDEVVVNRVTPPGARCPLCDGRRRAEAQVIATLAARLGARRLRFLPELDEEPRGAAALERVARALDGRSTALAPPAPRRAPSLRRRRGAPMIIARAPASPPTMRGTLTLAAPPSLRLLVFGGKGGVGKSTCAAAAAFAVGVRAPERRVLLLSTDPAHSLADVLGVPLDDQERTLEGAGGPPALRVRELDAARAFDAKRERYRDAVDELFDGLGGGSRFDAAYDRQVVRDLIDLAPPGLDELFAILSVIDALIAKPARYDLVVLDTAPTGHALRLLALPAAAHQWTQALIAILLKYRQAIGLGELAADLVELSRGLRRLQALLTDGESARFVAVSRAAVLPRVETERLMGALGDMRIALSALIVNAVTPPPPDGGCARCARVARREAPELARLADAAPNGCAILLSPLVAPPPRGIEALGRWARTWRRAPNT
jgi:arsenite-transporting ATPase